MANNNWRTPPEVFNRLNDEFEFQADMASSDENKLVNLHFTEEDDSLSFDWHDMIKSMFFMKMTKAYVFCNPPYDKPLPWIEQAIKAQKKGLGTVMILNADTSVKWFLRALKVVSEIRYITAYDDDEGNYNPGRIGFIDEKGNAISSNSKPQFILVFNPFKIGAQITSYVKKSEFYK